MIVTACSFGRNQIILQAESFNCSPLQNWCNAGTGSDLLQKWDRTVSPVLQDGFALSKGKLRKGLKTRGARHKHLRTTHCRCARPSTEKGEKPTRSHALAFHSSSQVIKQADAEKK